MKILITGATGFIGRELCKALAIEGHELVVLTRNPSSARLKIPAPHTAVEWDFTGSKDSEIQTRLKGIEAVIHLAGESIFGERWNSSFKEKLRDSRVRNTNKLIAFLESFEGPKPKVFIGASAVGYYGDGGDEYLDESSPPGKDFLAELCQDWENALFQSPLTHARKVALRLGIVLGKGGGALEQILPPFSLGLGGTLGSGKQWMSWIHLDDLIAIIREVLRNENLSGPINCCALKSITNAEFTALLAGIVHSAKFLNVPRPLLKAALGDASQVLLSSQRTLPGKLSAIQFSFLYPDIESALQAILGDSYALGYDEFLTQCWLPETIEKTFEFFSEARNLERITPPWLNLHLLSQSSPSVQSGTLIDYKLKLHGVPIQWRTEIIEWNPPWSFMDIQLSGPYKAWQHLHRFSTLQGGTLVEDQVHYRMPAGVIGKAIASGFVKDDLSKIFSYRAKKIDEILVRPGQKVDH